MLNKEKINVFSKGWSSDLDNNQERGDTIKLGFNGRLYSQNGVLAYRGIDGTTLVDTELGVIKYLGSFSFKDEVIAMAKVDTAHLEDFDDLSFIQENIIDWTLDIPYATEQSFLLEDLQDILNGISTEQVFFSSLKPRDLNDLLSNTYSCNNNPVSDKIKNFVLSGTNIPNYRVCNASLETVTPDNNKDYADAIFSIKEVNGVIDPQLIWVGNMNWDINKKMIVKGIDENSNLRRVYFTDNLNSYRSFNRHDLKLKYREKEHFDVNKNIALGAPVIEGVKEKGELPAMSVQYTYRLTTISGQQTSFSPLSPVQKILAKDTEINFQGGGVSEITNKSVLISVDITDIEKYSEIEMVALEYEANSIPTKITSLGIAPVAEKVYFNHYGNEADYDNNLTLREVLDNKHTWDFCSTIEIAENKMVAAAVRNTPYPFSLKYYEDMFLLKGWKKDGTTHDCLINPEPYNYRYINPSNTDLYSIVKKSLYSRYDVFGHNTIQFFNTETGLYVQKSFYNISNAYTSILKEVYDWLMSEDLSIFPNLKLEYIDDTLLLSRTVEETETDLSKYVFKNSSKQVIINVDNSSTNDAVAMTPEDLVYGAVSNGYNKGVGVRLSWQHEDISLATKTTTNYTSGKIFDLKKPTLKKYFKKGEIYRVGLLMYKNGNPLFTLVLGDLKVPEQGDFISYIDKSGNGVNLEYENLQASEDDRKYSHQKVKGQELFSTGITLKAEVRFPCELNDLVDSFRIVYVERTEFNRTILCQGLSAPMQRIASYGNSVAYGIDQTPRLENKWQLPFYGGPFIETFGLQTYDTFGPNFDDAQDNKSALNQQGRFKHRVVTNRKLFYFDSPDFIYGKLSDKDINGYKASVIGALNTDSFSMAPNNGLLMGNGTSFSRKISPIQQVPSGYYAPTFGLFGMFNMSNQTSSQLSSKEESMLEGDKDMFPDWIDASMFSSFNDKRSTHEIEATSYIAEGEIIPGFKFDLEHAVSNNAMSLHTHSWWYSAYSRIDANHGATLANDGAHAASELLKTMNVSTGYRSLIVATKTDLFTDDFMGERPFEGMNSFLKNGGDEYGPVPLTDTHALIELRKDNLDSVYGGRTKYDLEKSVFKALGPIIPLHKTTNQSQIFTVFGDTYITLYNRARNTYHNANEKVKHTKLIHSNSSREGDLYRDEYFNKGGAWIYGVVLETQVEPRLNHYDVVSNSENPFDFESPQTEIINKAYDVDDVLKTFIPKPHNFIDNPISPNILSFSKVKLSGDQYDSWSEFLANDFYPLPLRHGYVHNLVNNKNKLYAIQRDNIAEVDINLRDIIQTREGADVALYKGTGTPALNHKNISNYGTTIRGSVNNVLEGFMFIDPENNELIYNGKSLSISKNINLSFKELFESDPIIDSGVFLDRKFKEANLFTKTVSGKKYIFSYNEILNVLNGIWEYPSVNFMPLGKRVYASKDGAEHLLYELNTGNPLELFGEQKKLKLGFIVNDPQMDVNLYKKLQIKTNINYPVDRVRIYVNTDVDDAINKTREILGSHFRYKIIEGVHHIPLQNINERHMKRGEWAYIEIELGSENKVSPKISSIITAIRKSTR